MKRSVEGSLKKSTRTFNSFPRNVCQNVEKTHSCATHSYFVFLLVQFRVPCGRPPSPGAGQAGKDWLPPAVNDGSGTDAGVVPPQGDGVIAVFLFPQCIIMLCQPFFNGSTPDASEKRLRLSQLHGFRLSSRGDRSAVSREHQTTFQRFYEPFAHIVRYLLSAGRGNQFTVVVIWQFIHLFSV